MYTCIASVTTHWLYCHMYTFLKASAQLRDSAVVRLCVSRAVVRADTAHYTSRTLSPPIGVYAYFSSCHNKCMIEVRDQSWRFNVSNPQEWTHKPVMWQENLRAWWHHVYVTRPVAESCDRKTCIVRRPLGKASWIFSDSHACFNRFRWAWLTQS